MSQEMFDTLRNCGPTYRWRKLQESLYLTKRQTIKLDLPKRRLNMSSSLSPELKALCELASREYDPAKLLELTNQISGRNQVSKRCRLMRSVY